MGQRSKPARADYSLVEHRLNAALRKGDFVEADRAQVDLSFLAALEAKRRRDNALRLKAEAIFDMPPERLN